MGKETTLATAGRNPNLTVTVRETERRNITGHRPLSRKAFFANKELSEQFEGNYFKYMKSNESIGAIASEEARAAGLVFLGFNRSTDKVTGELLATSVRWGKAPKGKADDEIAKLRAELNAALAKLAAK